MISVKIQYKAPTITYQNLEIGDFFIWAGSEKKTPAVGAVGIKLANNRSAWFYLPSNFKGDNGEVCDACGLLNEPVICLGKIEISP